MAGLDISSFTYWYIGLNVCLLFVVAVLKWDLEASEMDNLKRIWSARSVYSAVLVQLFDQATDLAVLLIWWDEAAKELNNEQDIEHVDMTVLVALSIVSIASSRITVAILVKRNYDGTYFDSFLAMTELYIIKQVYRSVMKTKRRGKVERTAGMKIAQLVEANLESIPQIVLQCVYILRTYGTQHGEANIEFFVFSLFWSIIGASKKYTRVDSEPGFTFVPEISKWRFHRGFPCIDFGCLLRHIWRLMDVMCRLCLFIVLWAVCGGPFLALFLILTFVVYIHVLKTKYFDFETLKGARDAVDNLNGDFRKRENGAITNNNSNVNNERKCATLNALPQIFVYFVFTHFIGILWFFDDARHNPLPSDHMKHRFIENVLFYGLVIMFAFVDFNCPLNLCAESEIRNANDNSYVYGFLVFGCGACLFEPIFFCIVQQWAVPAEPTDNNAPNVVMANNTNSSNNNHDSNNDNDAGRTANKANEEPQNGDTSNSTN